MRKPASTVEGEPKSLGLIARPRYPATAGRTLEYMRSQMKPTTMELMRQGAKSTVR